MPGRRCRATRTSDHTTRLPITWPEAALAFERSAFIREYLGADFQQLFVTTRRGELQDFESHVSPLEYEWYVRRADIATLPATARHDDFTAHRSYYAATANIAPRFDALDGDMTADVCVIGGGIAGCSTALHLAERGYRVVLLEAQHIGWGASGRSGGQAIVGLRLRARQIDRCRSGSRMRDACGTSRSKDWS